MDRRRTATGLISLAMASGAFTGGRAVSLGSPAPSRPPRLGHRAYRQQMDNIEDLQYYGNVTLGGQEIRAILDTGSIEFVVISDQCAYWCGNAEHLYHSNSSATHRKGSLAQVLSYGSGDLEVREAYDNVQIGPLRGSLVPFWETTDANMALLLNSNFQAIIGLGPTAPNTKVMRYAASSNAEAYAPLQKLLHIGEFSVCLLREPGSHGYVTWHDKQLSQKPDFFTELIIPDTGYWMVKLQDVKLGNKLIGCAAGCGAVIDSGTSLIAVPQGGHDAMRKALEALSFDCTDLSTLPDLHFSLNGIPYSLPPDSYMGEIQGDLANTASRQFEFVAIGSRRNQSCGTAVMHISMDSEFGDVWILGMPFFRKYYSVFAQLTPQSPAAVYTALADPHCFPANHSPTQLVGGHPKQSARQINVEKLQVPPWASKAQGRGKLSNSRSSTPFRWSADEGIPVHSGF